MCQYPESSTVFKTLKYRTIELGLEIVDGCFNRFHTLNWSLILQHKLSSIVFLGSDLQIIIIFIFILKMNYSVFVQE